MKEKDNLYKDFNLPSYLSGKSFADASKAIERKFGERTDKVSNETKQELLERLSEAQEFLKMRMEAKNSGTNTLALGGTVYDERDASVIAGDPNTNQAIDGTKDTIAKATGPFGQLFRGIQKAGQGIGNTVGGDAGAGIADAFSPEESTIANFKDKDLSAGEKIAGTVPILGGIIARKSQNNKIQEARKNNTLLGHNTLNNDYATGGYQDLFKNLPYKDKKDKLGESNTYLQNQNILNKGTNKLITPPNKVNNSIGKDIDASLNDNNIYSGPLNADTFTKHQKKEKRGEFLNKVGEVGKKTGKWLGENAGEIMRYAPILGNLTDKLKRGQTERGSRLDDVYNPKYFDEARLINLINQNNNTDAIVETSGGNVGNLKSNLIGGNLTKLKAISDAYFKGSEVNRQEDKFKFSSNLQKNNTNVQLDRDFINRKAQDEGAYQTAKSAKRAALFEDIGKIGKEETYKKMVKEMFGYKWNGKYWIDSEGKEHKDEDVKKKLKDNGNNK